MVITAFGLVFMAFLYVCVGHPFASSTNSHVKTSQEVYKPDVPDAPIVGNALLTPNSFMTHSFESVDSQHLQRNTQQSFGARRSDINFMDSGERTLITPLLRDKNTNMGEDFEISFHGMDIEGSGNAISSDVSPDNDPIESSRIFNLNSLKAAYSAAEISDTVKPSEQAEMLMMDAPVKANPRHRSAKHQTGGVRDKSSDRILPWSTKVAEQLLRQFDLGQSGFPCTKQKALQAERNFLDLNAVVRMCKDLENQLDLNDIVARYPDLTPIFEATTHALTMMEVLSRFTISDFDCHLIPYNLSVEFARSVVHGSIAGVASMETTLSHLHHAVMGNPHYVTGISLVEIYTTRLPLVTRQSRRWYAQALFAYVTLVQSGAVAVWRAGLGIQGANSSSLDAVTSLFRHCHALQVDHVTPWLRKVDDSYENLNRGPFSVFKAKRDIDSTISINMGVVGVPDRREGGRDSQDYDIVDVSESVKGAGKVEGGVTAYNQVLITENEELEEKKRRKKREVTDTLRDDVARKEIAEPERRANSRANRSRRKHARNQTSRHENTRELILTDSKDVTLTRGADKTVKSPVRGRSGFDNRSVAPLKGCRFIMQEGSLSMRCSAISAAPSSKTTQTMEEHQRFSDEAPTCLTNLRDVSAPLVKQSTNSLTCVDTSWVITNKADQTICAVRLIVDERTNCLGLGVFFCGKDAGVSEPQGWVFSNNKTTPSRPRKNGKAGRDKGSKRKEVKWRWNWASSDYQVDNHGVLPQYPGWLTGMRLYNKGWRLAIALRTSLD